MLTLGHMYGKILGTIQSNEFKYCQVLKADDDISLQFSRKLGVDCDGQHGCGWIRAHISPGVVVEAKKEIGVVQSHCSKQQVTTLSHVIVCNRCETAAKFHWKNRLTFRDIYVQSSHNHSFPIIFRKHTQDLGRLWRHTWHSKPVALGDCP